MNFMTYKWVSYRIGMHHEKGIVGKSRTKEEYEEIYDNFIESIKAFSIKFHETTSFIILGDDIFSVSSVIESVKVYLDADFDKVIVGDSEGNISFFGDVEDIESLKLIGGQEG